MKQLDVTHCKVADCSANAEVIILRRFESNRNGENVVFGYCNFHAIIAQSLFRNSVNRQEVKGIRP